MNKLNTLIENDKIQNKEVHKENKIDKYINWLKESTTIDIWNNQTLEFYDKENNWWFNQIELQIIDKTKPIDKQKIWELICSIDWVKANLAHRLVQKESPLKWFELLQIIEQKIKEHEIKKLTMQCSQIDVVERWKKQWFTIDENQSNKLAEEYLQNPQEFTVYDFDLNMWYKLHNVSIKKSILQEIMLMKLEKNDMNQCITKDDLDEYCKSRNINIKYTEEYIKEISPRFYLTKDLQ